MRVLTAAIRNPREIYHQFTVGYLLNTSELEPVYEVNIFPNPSSGIFNAEILFGHKQDVSIQVFDVTGRVVYDSRIKNVINKMVDIDLSNEPAGIYSAHFITSEKEWVKKIVVSK